MRPRRPYPLQWPHGWPRRIPKERRRSPFGGRAPLSPYETAKKLMRELRLLGAVNAVITSQLPTRHDGLPYSDGRSDDPAIAVWFHLADPSGAHHERVFACDRWHTHAENLRAIAKSVEALRGLERWGMTDVVTRAFAGFAALPPGTSAESSARTWREVFDVSSDLGALDAGDLLAIVKARHRKLIAAAHPDAGGSAELAAEINAALDAAAKELS